MSMTKKVSLCSERVPLSDEESPQTRVDEQKKRRGARGTASLNSIREGSLREPVKLVAHRAGSRRRIGNASTVTGGNADGRSTVGHELNHTDLVVAESANASGLVVRRGRVDFEPVPDTRVILQRRCSVERVAALDLSVAQKRVNQAGRARCCVRARRGPAERLQVDCVTGSPRRGIGHFRRADRAHRTHCRGFVGRDLRAQQVRNCDRRDDQNDRYDDQQFDKGKTLLLLHVISLNMSRTELVPEHGSLKSTEVAKHFRCSEALVSNSSKVLFFYQIQYGHRKLK